MRIEPVDPSTAPDPVRALLELMPGHPGLFGTLAHAESLLEPFMRMAGAFLSELSLDHTLREIAILRVAHLCACDYEWTQHVPIARSLGFSAEMIAAVQRGGGAPLDTREQAVLHFVDDVYRNAHASDATFEQVSKHLEARQVVELVMTVGFYHMLARVLETVEVPSEEPAEEFIERVTR